MTIGFDRCCLVVAVAAASLVVGCSSEPTDPLEAQLAADGSEAMIASSQSTNLTTVVLDVVALADPATAAAELLSPTKVLPWACVTRARDAAAPETVHLTFEDCTGPFGLLHIDGEETVSFSASSKGGLHADITSVSLTAEGAPVQHVATVDVTFTSATVRDVIWQGTWVRTNDAGVVISHDADLEIGVDHGTGCRSATGSAATRVDTRSVDTVLSGYRVCRDMTTGLDGCPMGSAVHTSTMSGKTVTMDFNGSPTANVTGAKGDTFDLNLACSPVME